MFFEDVAAAVTESVLGFEADGTIVFANRAATNLLEYDSEDLLDRSVEDLLPVDQRETFSSLVERVERDEPTPVQSAVLDRRGRERSVTLCVRGTTRDDRELFVLTFHERQANAGSEPDQAAGTGYARRLRALNEATRLLMSAETADEIARSTVDVVERVLDRSLTAVWTAVDDEPVLRVAAASAEANRASDGPSGTIEPIRDETAEKEVFEGGEPVVLEEYAAVANPAHPEMGLDTRLVVPLGSHGVLAVGSRGGDEFTDSVRELIEILAETVRAAFDRLEREEMIRQRSAAIDAATDGMGITDEDGIFRYVNDVYAEMFGYDESIALVDRSWKRLFGQAEIDRFEAEVMPAVSEEGSWCGGATGRRANGTEFPIELSLSTLADGGTVCIVRDVTDRHAHVRQLELLTAVAQELMRAEDREEIAHVGVRAVEGVLGFEIGCLRLIDGDTGELRCIDTTSGADSLLESLPGYELESSLAGYAYREGRTVRNLTPADTGSPVDDRSVHVPVGECGVLSIVLADEETIDDRQVQLVEMLAVSLGTAYGRAQRDHELKAHERAARRRGDQLETLTRINALVQEIGRRLVGATTRKELERTICENLVHSDLYHSAWIGEIDPDSDRVTTRTGSQITERDLEAINEMSLSSVANGTVERMVDSGTVEVVKHYQLDGGAPEDDAVATVRSTAAIPLTYGDRLLGVLVMNGVADGIFGEEAIRGFEALGEVTGFAINAIRNRRLLLSDTVTELEFAIADSETFYLAASAQLDCECRFERSVPVEAGKILNYHTVRGSDPASILELAGESAQIEEARVISEAEDRLLLQTLTSKSLAHTALAGGATLRSAVAVDGDARVVLEAPQTSNVREIVSLLEESYESVDLLAKREQDRSIQTADEFRQRIDGALTEKQRSALESAYASGYYDWPRAITAEELAESMGISSSTLHQHLRKGIASLLSAYLDDLDE